MKVLLLLLASIPSFAVAQLAYDGFRPESGYSPAAGKRGELSAQKLTGPAGWTGDSWNVPGPKGSELYRFSEEAALTFPAISYTGGGGVEITAPDANPRTRARNLAAPVPFEGKTAFYMSFLLRVDGKDCGGTAYAAFENAGGNNLGLGAGIHEGNLVLLSRTARGDRVLQAFGPAAPGTVYYFVIKLSDDREGWMGSDGLEIWVNATDVSSEEKATATAEAHFQDSAGHNAAAEYGIGRAMLYVENFADANVIFDELVLSESWADMIAPK